MTFQEHTSTIEELLRKNPHLLRPWLKINMERLGLSSVLDENRVSAQLEEKFALLGLDSEKSFNLDNPQTIADDMWKINNFTKTRFDGCVALFANFKGLTCENFHDATPYIFENIKNVVNEQDTRLVPDNFSLNLYSPQQAVLHRMVELEALPFTNIGTHTIASRICIFNERFSFGKTFLMSALLAHHPVPQTLNPEKGHTVFGIYSGKGGKVPEVESGVESGEVQEIIYTDTNVVVCSPKVQKEWISNLQRFTKLSVARVFNAKDLDKLSSCVTFPDVVVIKCGFIKWKEEKKQALDHFRMLRSGVARYIFDDYDMLKDCYKCELVPMRFTWLISATEDKKFQIDDPNSLGRALGMLPVVNFFSKVKCNVDFSALEFRIPDVAFYTLETLETFGKFGEDPNDDFDGEDPWNEMERYITLYKESEVRRHVDAVKVILSDESITKDETRQYKEFMGSGETIPFNRKKNAIKILISVENKDVKKSIIECLIKEGISVKGLDRRNVYTFGEATEMVGVSGLIHGVNMGYLSHVVVDPKNMKRAEMLQVIGRGQRLSRTYSLNVIFV